MQKEYTFTCVHIPNTQLNHVLSLWYAKAKNINKASVSFQRIWLKSAGSFSLPGSPAAQIQYSKTAELIKLNLSVLIKSEIRS